MKHISWLSILLLTACVTINIYFPAAAAEKVADQIIQDIQSNKVPEKNESAPKPSSQKNDLEIGLYRLLDQAISLAISSAQAGEADLSIDSPDIRRLRSSMESRFVSLQRLYASGVIGIKGDGFLAIRDGASVPLQDRNLANKLVAAENADRQALYQAIANANGHPEWVTQIKSTFASRWVGNAQSGWWYQASGQWRQK